MLDLNLVKYVCNGLHGKWRVNSLILEERYNHYNVNPFVYLQSDDRVIIRISNKEKGNVVNIGYIQPKIENWFISQVKINCDFSKSKSRILSDINNRIMIHYDECLNLLNEKEREILRKEEINKLNELAINCIKKVIRSDSIFCDDNYKNFSIKHLEKRKNERHRKIFGADVEVTKANIYQVNDNKYNVNFPDLTTDQLIKIIYCLGL